MTRTRGSQSSITPWIVSGAFCMQWNLLAKQSLARQSAPRSESHGEIVLYQAPGGTVALDVRLERETIWLSLNQMALLFDRDKSVISRHLRNVFKEGELQREATAAKNATVQTEGDRTVTRNVEFFNLDAVLSVGYRVNSRHLTSSSRSQGARSCSHGVLRCRTCGLRSSSLSSPGRRRHGKAQGCGDLQQGNGGNEHAYGP